MKLLVSPWLEDFERFGRSIRHRALLVAPFIADEPLARLSAILDQCNPPEVQILTNLSVDSMLQGATDVAAITSFCGENPFVTVRHLPGLHAKAYVADDRLAIITSGNLTYSSMKRNYEYGVQFTDSKIVKKISQDLQDYGNLGSEVPIKQLQQFAEISDALQKSWKETFRAARTEVRNEFNRQMEVAQESLRQLRADPGESTNAIFARTILYILREGSLTTPQIHSTLEGIHPDLCDNSIDRVINGVHFGRKWKHMVRNAQAFLRRKRLIDLDNGQWRLVQEPAERT